MTPDQEDALTTIRFLAAQIIDILFTAALKGKISRDSKTVIFGKAKAIINLVDKL